MSNHDADINSADGDAGEAVITKVSPWSVADTVSRLSSAVATRGMKLFAVIDHSGEASAVGLQLRDMVVIFGSPQAGTPGIDEQTSGTFSR